jgi:DNA-directed RNA polymerase subunit omega
VRSVLKQTTQRHPWKQNIMNPEFLKKALEKVGNPNILVNLVSRRVRQLNYGERSLLANVGTLGAADIALREIIEERMGWEVPEVVALVRPVRKKARRR